MKPILARVRDLDERTPLTVKLFGALAAIIIAGVSGCISWPMPRSRPVSTNSASSLAHARGMAPLFVNYYAQKGSWENVERLLAAVTAAHGGTGEHLILVGPDGKVLGAGREQATAGQTLSPGTINRGVPLLVEDRRIGTLLTETILGHPTALDRSFLSSINRAIWAAGLAAVVVATVTGALLVRRLTRPLRQLTSATRQIAAGDLQQQVHIRSRDELGQLGQAFNTMAEKLAHSERLRRNMIADIAHELRTPLTVLRGNLEALGDGVFEPTPERLRTLHEESLLLVRLVGDLRELSLAEAGELPIARRVADVGKVVERAVAAIRPEVEGRGITLVVQRPPALAEAAIDPDRIGQVLLNLLSNAQRYTPEGGRIAVSVQPGADAVSVSVSNTGPGIDPADVPYVFDRFWRGDRSRVRRSGGSGLGLAIARQLVVAHGGQIWVESRPGQGATFTFSLPRA